MNRHNNPLSWVTSCMWWMPLPGSRFAGTPPRSASWRARAEPAWMQQVAGELKHSETAFLSPLPGGWDLRWFTPAQEVDLCGHATLASAFVLWETGREQPGSVIIFTTRSGTLTARRDGEWISLDFPAEPGRGCRYRSPVSTGRWG